MKQEAVVEKVIGQKYPANEFKRGDLCGFGTASKYVHIRDGAGENVKCLVGDGWIKEGSVYGHSCDAWTYLGHVSLDENNNIIDPQAAKFKVGMRVSVKHFGAGTISYYDKTNMLYAVKLDDKGPCGCGKNGEWLTTEAELAPSESAEAKGKKPFIGMVINNVEAAPRLSYALDTRPVFEPIFHELAGQSAIALKYEWSETAGMMVHDDPQACFVCERDASSCGRCEHRMRK